MSGDRRLDEFRLGYDECLTLLRERLEEPAPGRIQLLCGPRQVGKTTLLHDLATRFGPASIYSAADAPEASLPGTWERLWLEAQKVAESHGRAIVLLDEAHLAPNWAARLKSEWDRIRRRKQRVHIVATGSSALRLGTGSRESLAGRFERVTLTHWCARDLSKAFHLSTHAAADLIVRRGAYPGAVAYRDDPRRWLAYVRDAIVEPAVGRDILAHAAVRRPALLRQVFSVAAASPAEIMSLQKLQGQMQESGAIETLVHYLGLLDDAFLVAPLQKHAERVTRQRAAPPKLVTLSNALLAAVDPRGIPEPAAEPDRFGRWVENACLAHGRNAGQRVTYWREEPLEVDAVIDGSWGSFAVEVKTGRVHANDLKGLLEFARRNPEHRPLLVHGEHGHDLARRVGIAAMHWRDFLLDGAVGAGA